ncbi:hypothetical protein NE865_01758 [Phthorimaea operculella]|nr:hypothetical protein NE865_01758 [Phthorimaea operculella]
MESSEDDAGAATNASRRASAREKDVGGGDGGGASDSMPPEPADPGAASETTSMSEEAFDADSVPDDVNTSTEAILDMIDEIVDGPDATRRRSYTSPEAEGASTAPADRAPDPPAPSEPDTLTPSSPTPASVCSAQSETAPQESASDPPTEPEPQNIAPNSEVCVEKVTSESVNNTNESCISTLPTGVGPPTEALVEAVDNSAQEDTTKSNLLPVEVDTRPAALEHSQTESSSCQEVAPDSENSGVPNVATVSELSSEGVQIGDNIENVPKKTESTERAPTPSPSTVQSDNACTAESAPEVPNEILPQSSPQLVRQTDSPQASSSVTSNEPAESTSEEAPTRSQSEPEEPSNLSPSVPSSSVAEPVQVESDSSENQICEQTIKCVTSSDNRDNVTVESAESTSESSSSSVREGRVSPVEAATRSPLRRRLVRPAPSDRRPDSTVSSSVDSSQNVHVNTTEQTSESVTKDVSSSSDAVTSVYCNIKPEEIRVSDISVCKAETSMNPPKKIKLVRQKSTPSVPQRDNTSLVSISQESEQCQSTSSEFTPIQQDTASSSRSCSQIEQPEETSHLSNECVTEPIAHLQESSSQISDKTTHEHDPKPENTDSISQPLASTEHQESSKGDQERRVPPIKLNLSGSSSSETATSESKSEQQEPELSASSADAQDTPDCAKQVPKLTIKLSSKQSEGPKSPIPKLTIKPIKPPPENDNSKRDVSEQKTSITKLNIKPIPKPAEKVNDVHRKSSSSEISESESSESNDESNSMSDPASNSDQQSVVPKVTIKVGKPGTESEGKFYTEQNAPKLLIKGLQQCENEDHESKSKLKLVVSQPEEKQHEKIPKLTIKTVSKSEGQPLSPKLTIKPIRPPESSVESTENPPIPKMKITAESFSSNAEVKENAHVPKITIKPVIKTDAESASSKTPKKSAVVCDSPEHIPVVTKLNIKPVLKPLECEVNNLEDRVPAVPKLHIKPIIKPTDSGTSGDTEDQIPVVSKLNIKPIVKPTETNEMTQSTEDIPVVSKLNIKPILKPPESGSSGSIDEKVPVVSKLNIKPIVKPKSNEVESSIEDIPKVTKLNIKPLRNPDGKSSEEKDCDVKKVDTEDSIPVVTKLNIKPIVKPVDEDASKDSENQSSETGNSSDENTDHIPVVTKLNIKPVLKPNDQEQDTTKVNIHSEESIPVVTKLNIKPLVKPDESKSPTSPKKDVKITKLNIKPVVKPDEIDQQKDKNEAEDGTVKNPPLLMKINIKNVADASSNDCFISDSKKLNNIDENKHVVNNVEYTSIPKVTKLNIKPIVEPSLDKSKGISAETAPVVVNCKQSSSQSHQKNVIPKQNCVPDLHEDAKLNEDVECPKTPERSISLRSSSSVTNAEVNKANDSLDDSSKKSKVQLQKKAPSAHQNCTLLKKLLETKKDGLDKRLEDNSVNVNHTKTSEADVTPLKDVLSVEQQSALKVNTELKANDESKDLRQNDVSVSEKASEHPAVESKCSGENLSKPLEISISDKLTNESSGQDSPRIILKINKTDHGASAQIITEERPSTPQQNAVTENTQETVNEKQSQKRVVNSRKKALPETPEVHVGKRLRSSRIVDEKTPVAKKQVGKRPPSTETSPVQNKVPELATVTPVAKKNAGKRPTSTETSPVQNKEPELSVLEAKRIKLGQLLSNTSLTITSVPAKPASVSPTKPSLDTKQAPAKTVNHSLLNNENCAKNGNSKLHNILSNLQAKQAQALAFSELKRAESVSITPELDSNTSTGSSDVVEVIVPIENDVITINDNSNSQDLLAAAEEVSQDPLEVEAVKPKEPSPSPVPLTTPQPKKRGRPRKLPLSEPPKQAVEKPPPVALPVPALEERPQRSLRLSRDRPAPAILAKPRGRGRGRGARRPDPPPREEPIVDTSNKFYIDESPVEEKTEDKPAEDIDPTSSRIKLPRMTEALDKLPSTPLSSRRRSSSASTTDLKMFDSEPKVVLDILPKLEEALGKSPETPSRGGRGGRGKRGGGRGATPGRTPRAGRGRGRGGGRGMQYMKETMGIYGRVCGPATTTVQLFEEETCMMDDNATPAKSTHFDDEDSQSSVLSSTNDSSRMKKSNNKVWTAADVKEYMWPPPETPGAEHQVMMIQEQVAMFLGVKSFKRRYPELKRRAVAAEERDYVLSKGLVSEPLCDLGITAVDASEVLDIMLSDYPHKYEEYRQHQRDKQRELEAAATAAVEERLEDSKVQEMKKIEMKVEAKPDAKPEPPKQDLEKTRQEALAAAIASASEYNTRINALRRPAYVDLQTHTIHKRRPLPTRAPEHVVPPAGLYPHALLPGQYQHTYRTYTPEQLRAPEHVVPPAGLYPHALLPGQYQHTYRTYTPEQLRAPEHVVPPAGLYPHALLPGQYQHTYRTYTPEQLRAPEHVVPPAGLYPHALLPGQYQHTYRTYTPEQLRAPEHVVPPAGLYPHALLPGQYQHTYRTYMPEQLRAPEHVVPPAGLYPHALLPGQYQHTYRTYTPEQLRAPEHVVPPAGLYPHALLPGQYQHTYRTYTPEQLRYFPLNTVLAAPPPPPSPPPSSESEEWSSSSSEDEDTSRHAKRSGPAALVKMRTPVDTLRSVTPVDTPLILPSEHCTGGTSPSALAPSVFGIRRMVQQL